MPRIAVCLLMLALCGGCGAELVDNEVGCYPTGNALVATGVYIGDLGCAEVTLQRMASDGSTSSGWALAVGYPAPVPAKGITFFNRTTGDKENEVFYSGNPEFKLTSGQYLLGGLKVEAGPNAIEVHDYPCPLFDCSKGTPFDSFSLKVNLE